MTNSLKLEALSVSELQRLIGDAQKALAAKVNAERSELLKKLEALDAIDQPTKRATPNTSKNRGAKPKEFRGPSGREYANTGSIPKELRALGVTDKAGLEPYRIKD